MLLAHIKKLKQNSPPLPTWWLLFSFTSIFRRFLRISAQSSPTTPSLKLCSSAADFFLKSISSASSWSYLALIAAIYSQNKRRVLYNSTYNIPIKCLFAPIIYYQLKKKLSTSKRQAVDYCICYSLLQPVGKQTPVLPASKWNTTVAVFCINTYHLLLTGGFDNKWSGVASFVCHASFLLEKQKPN